METERGGVPKDDDEVVVVEEELSMPTAYMSASEPSEVLEGGVDKDEGNKPLQGTRYPELLDPWVS